MNASFTKFLSKTGLPFWIALGAMVLGTSIFIAFRVLSAQDNARTSQAVASLLRNEYETANSYALAKSISDLEHLNILNCALLIERNEVRRVFYDTTTGRNCWTNPLFSRIRENAELQAVNGLIYELSFQPPVRVQSLALEFLCYLVTVCGGWALSRRIQSQEIRAKLNLAALKFKHELAVDNAKQVKHDAAAPISALKMIVQAAGKNLDPEVRSFLFNAVSRTEEIFDRLNVQNAAPSVPTCLRTAMADILAEKRGLWKDRCRITLDCPAGPVIVEARDGELRSLLSNLLNNSFEALEGTDAVIAIVIHRFGGTISLSIQDNGKGMSPEALKRIGQKGFSSGKLGIIGAGSGLGVYNARMLLQGWGGDLTYQSRLGNGTTAHLVFQVVQNEKETRSGSLSL